jgi:hypothetical protein
MGQFSTPSHKLISRVRALVRATSVTPSVTFYSRKSCNPTTSASDIQYAVPSVSGGQESTEYVGLESSYHRLAM